MSRVRYYIITDAQAAILASFNISYEMLGGKLCVRDWQSCVDAVDEIVWEDGELSDEEGEMLDIMDEQVDELYWSTEGKFWS